MEIRMNHIEKEALRLPPQEREILAVRLLKSLDNEAPNDVDEAWIQEAERRYQNFRNGKTRGISGEHVFDDIRQELGWQK